MRKKRRLRPLRSNLPDLIRLQVHKSTQRVNVAIYGTYLGLKEGTISLIW